MLVVKIKACGSDLEISQPILASGSAGVVRADFEFDGQWQGLAKTAIFQIGETSVFMPLEGGSCLFPGEALARAGETLVGVLGTNGEKTLATIYRRVSVSHGVAKNAEAAENYTAGLYEQLSAKIEGIENMNAVATEGDAAAAEIVRSGAAATLRLTLPKGAQGDKGDQGEQGIQGEQGADGYTPQRGVDYWTDADKAEIKSYVDEAILGGEW